MKRCGETARDASDGGRSRTERTRPRPQANQGWPPSRRQLRCRPIPEKMKSKLGPKSATDTGPTDA
eukprot:7735005-Pyramimonas_sp.AAC.1